MMKTLKYKPFYFSKDSLKETKQKEETRRSIDGIDVISASLSFWNLESTGRQWIGIIDEELSSEFWLLRDPREMTNLGILRSIITGPPLSQKNFFKTKSFSKDNI